MVKRQKIVMDDYEQKIYRNLEKYLISALQDKTPVKSSNAQEGWKIKRIGKMQFKLVNDIEYANVLEYGSKPHLILPKRAKFLKFKKPKGARKKGKKLPGNLAFEKDGYIFAKKVWHPGTEALHIVKKTLEDDKMWAKVFGL